MPLSSCKSSSRACSSSLDSSIAGSLQFRHQILHVLWVQLPCLRSKNVVDEILDHIFEIWLQIARALLLDFSQAQSEVGLGDYRFAFSNTERELDCDSDVIRPQPCTDIHPESKILERAEDTRRDCCGDGFLDETSCLHICEHAGAMENRKRLVSDASTDQGQRRLGMAKGHTDDDMAPEIRGKAKGHEVIFVDPDA